MMTKIIIGLVILVVLGVLAAYSKVLDKFLAAIVLIATVVLLYYGYTYLSGHGLPF